MRIGQKQIGAGLVVLGALAIAAATLTPVPGSMGGGTSRICLICHDRGMADFVSNIILFAPLGLGLALLGRRWYFALAVGALYSLTVESLQLDVIAGRDANFGDLVANSLGAVTGWFFGVTRSWWRPTPDRATTRAIGVTVAGSVLLLGALVLLRPAPQEATYYLQWTPALGGGMHIYLGEVTETRIGPLHFDGPGKIAASDSVRALLHRPDWAVTFRAGLPPRRIAPIVSIYDEEQDEVVVLAAAGHDLVYRQRLLANQLLFDGADLRMAGALQALQPGRNVVLQYRQTLREQCLTLDGARTCERGYTVGDTWSLLMFPDNWGFTERTVMAFAFLSGLFGLGGFLSPGARTLAVQVALAVGVLLAGPPLLGYAPTPPVQLLAALTGLVAGWTIAQFTSGKDGGREPSGFAPSGAGPGRPRLKDVSSARSYTRSDGT